MLPLLTKLKIRPFINNPGVVKDAVIIGYNPVENEYISTYEFCGEAKSFCFYAGQDLEAGEDWQVDVL